MLDNKPRIALALLAGLFVGVGAGLVAGLLGYQSWVVGPIVAVASAVLLQIIPRNRNTRQR